MGRLISCWFQINVKIKLTFFSIKDFSSVISSISSRNFEISSSLLEISFRKRCFIYKIYNNTIYLNKILTF